MDPPHPSALREPAQKFNAYYSVTKGWEVGIYTVWYVFVFPILYPRSHPYIRAIAESRITGIVGGSAAKKSKSWQSAYHYYSISYYAGVVKVVPQRLVAPPPIANRFTSPATGSPSHPIYIASTQVTPASGTLTHPYVIPSTPNSPNLLSPAQATSFGFSGSPISALQPRQFLRVPAPASGSIPQLSFAVGPIPANSCVTISTTVDAPQPNVTTTTPNTTPNTTPHRGVVYVVSSDSDVDSDSDDSLPVASYRTFSSTHTNPSTPTNMASYRTSSLIVEAGSFIHTNPSTPTNVASRRASSLIVEAGSSIRTNPSTPTNVASHHTSSLVVEDGDDEYFCSDFEDPEFLQQLNVVLASHSSP